MPCYFILAERSIPMGFRSMVSSTLSSIAAITVGGVLTVIGIVSFVLFVDVFLAPWGSAALCLPPWASSSLSPPLYGLGVP